MPTEVDHWRHWRISLMTDDECIKALMPPKIDFWIHNNLMLIWRIRHWNWFNSLTDKRGFILFLRHGFREWHK